MNDERRTTNEEPPPLILLPTVRPGDRVALARILARIALRVTMVSSDNEQRTKQRKAA